MLPKSRRLSAKEVRQVLKNGRSARSGAVLARYIPAASSKAAVVVSGKVAKKATERNRLRRVGYRALPNRLQALPKTAHVVFFIQKKEFSADDIATLCSKLS